MKKIPLSQQGKNKDKHFALVDDEDFDKVNKFRWSITNNGYALKKSGTRQMHRLILNTPKGKDTDHINGNKLDNRRENLRVVTRSENNANQKINKNNTSGYKGVSWNRNLQYWTANIKVNRKHFVKYFKTKREAAIGYNKMMIKNFGEFALLNKIV